MTTSSCCGQNDCNTHESTAASTATATASQPQSGPAPQAQSGPAPQARRFQAAVDVYESPEAVVVAADVPGASADQVDVSFQDGVLSLYAKVAPRNVGWTPRLKEYGVGDYRRELRVGDGVDAERISAQLKDGVLTVVLPKRNDGRPRKIQVT